MDTITIKGFILKCPITGAYMHSSCQMPEYGYITVCPHDMEVPMPATFNPVVAEVAMLNKKLDTMAAEHDRAAKVIKDRISNLLCLEYTPA